MHPKTTHLKSMSLAVAFAGFKRQSPDAGVFWAVGAFKMHLRSMLRPQLIKGKLAADFYPALGIFPQIILVLQTSVVNSQRQILGYATRENVPTYE